MRAPCRASWGVPDRTGKEGAGERNERALEDSARHNETLLSGWQVPNGAAWPGEDILDTKKHITDTEIDYPVRQCPTNKACYLGYNLDGSRGYPGCIYAVTLMYLLKDCPSKPSSRK